ncbi:hypothetical protein [Rosistilla oblonga]|uniref:hypothetical protein n=1 Tax=Rosistilla oblonga TaxID=2527990 RepID=UPI003A9860E4
MQLSIILATADDHPTKEIPCPFVAGSRAVDRDVLIRTAGVPMARRHSYASLMAIAAARNCLKDQDLGNARIGVIATGGSNHLDVAWTLTKGIIDEGSEFIDPLSFPHSIPSSIAASVAIACKATAFALGIGHSSHAFFEAMAHSTRMINAGFADAALIVAVHHSSPVVVTAAQKGFGRNSRESSMCALLTPATVSVPSLKLMKVQLSHGARIASPTVCDNLPTDRVFTEENLGYSKVDSAFAATGGNLLLKAAYEMSLRRGDMRQLPFAVTLGGNQRSSLLVSWKHLPNHQEANRADQEIS